MKQDISRCHFSKFTDCARELELYAKRVQEVKAETLYPLALLAKTISFGIKSAQRFYFPADAGILGGKELTKEIIDMAKLPYPQMAILSTQLMFNPDGTDGPTCDRITIALNVDEQIKNVARAQFSDEMTSVVSGPMAPEARSFGILSAIKEQGQWIPHPIVGNCHLGPYDGRGYALRAVNYLPEYKCHNDRIEKEVSDDAFDVLNLCVMLGLHNVNAKEVIPPEALNRKRERCGVLPLYSYHVLVVDGDSWDATHASKEGSGVRSHLRRGHVRRLHESERKIWVRATMVHGSRPGFVDKEYHIQ